MKLRLNLEPRRRKHLPITVFVEPDHSAVFRVHAAVYLFPPVTRKKGIALAGLLKARRRRAKDSQNLQKKKEKMWGGGWKQRGKARRRLQCGAKKVSPSIPSPPLCALLRKKKRKNVASSACCACLRRTRPLQTLQTEKSEDEKEKF